MGRYVLGVDGGGTKTHCMLTDLNGNGIDSLLWGPTNHDSMKDSYVGLKRELNGLFKSLMERNSINLDDIEFSVFGMSGVDTRKQHKIISGILQDIGLSKFILCNDAYLGIKAGSKEGWGICAINGTGCTVAGIDKSGNSTQIGGFGSLTGDKGGGGYLGMRLIQAVYNNLYRGYPQTGMKDFLFKTLGITDKEDFIENLKRDLDQKTIRLKDFNRFVFEAANEGDEVALDILRDIGKSNAASINYLISTMELNESNVLDIILAGSIHVKGENSTIIDTLKKTVLDKNSNLNINFKILMVPPVTGAIAWALEQVKGKDGL